MIKAISAASIARNHMVSVEGDVGNGEVYAIALHYIPDQKNPGKMVEDFMAVRYIDNYRRCADGKWRFEISDADAKLKDRAQWATQRDALQAKSEAALQSKWAAEEARNAWLRQRGESPSRISSESKKNAEFKALA